jgi:hypothetical protein
VTDNTGYGYNVDTATSEMASMFYDTLGVDEVFLMLSNTGPFENLQYSYYWSAPEYAPDTDFAWSFLFDDGSQDINPKTSSLYGWAVHAALSCFLIDK